MEESLGQSDKRKLSRREVLTGFAVTAVAGISSNETIAAEEDVQLDPKSEGDIQSIVDRAIDKNDKYASALLDAQNGAIQKNYRLFVIKHTLRGKVALSDEEIVARRDKILQSVDFKVAYMREMIKKGFPENAGSSEVRYLLDKIGRAPDAIFSSFNPQDLPWRTMSDVDLARYVGTIPISVRYNASSKGVITFDGPYFQR